jgi:hypothetical protein
MMIKPIFSQLKPNKKMKTITRIFAMLAVVSALIFMDACKGPAGDVGPAGVAGPAGPTGATGAIGATGAVGATGNANVIQVSYASRTHTGTSLNYNLPATITKAVFDNSAYFVYVSNIDGNTYSLPGWFTGGTNTYRVGTLVSTGVQGVFISRVAGTGSDVFNTTRIVVIPANDLRTGRKAAVDYTDYEAVKKFYNLKD